MKPCLGMVWSNSKGADPKQVTVSSFLAKNRLAVIRSGFGDASCPAFVRPCVCLESALVTCPPCVCLESAVAAPPNFDHQDHVSASSPPCVRPESALAASPNLSAMCLPCLGLCPPRVQPCVIFGRVPCVPCLLSTICPLKPWPCLWTLPALGLLWGRAVASSGKVLSHHCATHHVYIACPLVSFLHIFILAHQIRPSLADPMLEKLFGVYLVQSAFCFTTKNQAKTTNGRPREKSVTIGFAILCFTSKNQKPKKMADPMCACVCVSTSVPER